MITCYGDSEDQKARKARLLKYTEQKLENKIKSINILIDDSGQDESTKNRLRKKAIELLKALAFGELKK